MSTDSAPDVALATAREVADLDDEGRLLAAALADRGARVAPAVWDDADVDWAGFDLVVVRSTWDYAPRVAEFVTWAERVGAVTRLENPPGLLRWSTDKHYLLDLERAGVPVVPSAFLEAGADPGGHPWAAVEHVVKPAVSAGSKDTLRLGAHDAERSRAHAADLLAAGRSVLVQPYLDAVDTEGETAVVLVDGVFSHAIRKAPLLQAGGGLVEGLFARRRSPRASPRRPSWRWRSLPSPRRRAASRRSTPASTCCPRRTVRSCWSWSSPSRRCSWTTPRAPWSGWPRRSCAAASGETGRSEVRHQGLEPRTR